MHTTPDALDAVIETFFLADAAMPAPMHDSSTMTQAVAAVSTSFHALVNPVFDAPRDDQPLVIPAVTYALSVRDALLEEGARAAAALGVSDNPETVRTRLRSVLMDEIAEAAVAVSDQTMTGIAFVRRAARTLCLLGRYARHRDGCSDDPLDPRGPAAPASDAMDANDARSMFIILAADALAVAAALEPDFALA